MLTQNQIASLYQQTSAQGVSRVGLVVKLYDRILGDLQEALSAVAANDIERRVSSINHALLIVGELQGVLDFDGGGQVAKRLEGFYNVTRAMMVEANARASSEMITKLVDLYVPMRQAWQQVELDVASGQIQLPALAPPVTQRASPESSAGAHESEPSTSRWNA